MSSCSARLGFIRYPRTTYDSGRAKTSCFFFFTSVCDFQRHRSKVFGSSGSPCVCQMLFFAERSCRALLYACNQASVLCLLHDGCHKYCLFFLWRVYSLMIWRLVLGASTYVPSTQTPSRISCASLKRNSWLPALWTSVCVCGR